MKQLKVSQWAELMPQHRWDIIAGMRGPDLLHPDSKRLKWFSTAILRHKVGPVLRPWQGSAMVNDSISVVCIPQRTSGLVNRYKPFDFNHFHGHILEACVALGVPHLEIPEDWWMAMIEKKTDLGAVKVLKAHLIKHGWGGAHVSTLVDELNAIIGGEELEVEG